MLILRKSENSQSQGGSEERQVSIPDRSYDRKGPGRKASGGYYLLLLHQFRNPRPSVRRGAGKNLSTHQGERHGERDSYGVAPLGHQGSVYRLFRTELMNSFWKLLCASIVLLVAIDTQAAELSRLKAIYSTISPPTAPLWIAKERGLFEKHGLSVDLVFIESAPRSVQALLSGDALIATGAGPAVANAKLSGADVVMIAGLVNVFPFFLVAHSGIDSVTALKGKIGATQVFGSGGDLSVRTVLRKLGLDPERDVTLRVIGGSTLRIQALEKRLVDFALLEPMMMFGAKKANLKILVDFTQEGIPYQHTGIITLNSSIKKNRPLILNFLKAVGEGIVFYKRHRQETMAIMARHARLDDPEVLETSYEWFKKVFLDVPYPTRDGFKSILEMLYTSRKGVSHLEPEALVDRSLLEELVREGFFRSLAERSRN